jgi:hypothetical protein
MNVEWTPFRWPSSWTDAARLALVRGTAINCLLIDSGPAFDAVRTQARQDGLRVGAPDGVHTVKGEWAGVRLSRSPGDGASAGPTGVAWVNSNGWAVRLAAATHPNSAIWVQAAPEEGRVHPASSYLITLADTGSHGGRWIIELDTAFAARLAEKDAASLTAWKGLCDAAGLFAAHKEWGGYDPQAGVGVISSFTGEQEFFGGELLNLLARAGQHSRILIRDGITRASFESLRAVIYADAGDVPEALGAQIREFVRGGGLLITHASRIWKGEAAAAGDEHPRFTISAFGKGRIALAKEANADPYEWANDAAVLVSHRYDLVRFWNGGATGSYYTMAADRRRGLVHLLFYADRGPDAASVRVTGAWRAARMRTAGSTEARSVKMIVQKDAVEIHLPQVSQYVALELDA